MDVNNVHSETPERENFSNASQMENIPREPLHQDRNLAEETSSSMPLVTLEISDQVTGTSSTSNQETRPGSNGPSVRSPSVDGTHVVNGHWNQEERLVLEQRPRECAHLLPGPALADRVFYL